MIARTNFEGDPNVGAFAVITDRVIFTSPNMSEKSLDTLERVFNLPMLQSTVAKMDAVGIFSVANSEGLVLPYTTTDEELVYIKENSDLRVDWIDSKMTALGNVILANDHGAICHPDFDKAAKDKIADVLDVEVVTGTVARLPIVGSNIAATNNGAVVHPMASSDETDSIAEVLRVHVEVGTVNRGSPYTSLGVLANSDGMVAGSDTTGVELAHISQVLGFV
ncbi:MAG: translation initiation factor IF-6 [Candidatus Thorarchaeota archaeon]|nr:MAG: translation initiation factor IF-6 [Candidatus Thorarchaeota archaeon]